MLGRTWLAVLAVVLGMGVASGEDAGGRNINDSNVTTLVGGVGDGAANALTVPLYGLNGGITRDAAGNLYFTEYSRVFKLTPTGALSHVAGSEDFNGGLFGGDGGPAINAALNFPTLLAFDPNGNLLVVDEGNNRIRRIGTDGIINTVIGNGNSTSQISDIGRPAIDSALPTNIVGIGANASGDIFFASGDTDCIYKVLAVDGRLALVAGDGTTNTVDGGSPAAGNPLGGNIRGMALAPDGTIIFSADFSIRQIDAAGNNNVIAGLINNATNKVPQSGNILFPDDGTQDALQIQPLTPGISNPQGVAVDGTTIVFWDDNEERIRSFTIGGKIQTIFGERGETGFTGFFGGRRFRQNGILAAPNTPHPTMAPFNPLAFNDDPLAFIGSNSLVASGGVVAFVDSSNGTVSSFTVGGNVTTVAGATDANRINNINNLTTFTLNVSNNVPVPAKGAALYQVSNVTCSPAGVFFTALDWNHGYNGIYKYDAATQTISLTAGMQMINGKLVAESEGGPATGFNPTIDGNTGQVSLLSGGGFLFVDRGQSTFVRAVDATGNIITVAGNGTANGVDPSGDPLLRVAEVPVPSEFGTTNTTGATGFGRTGKLATNVGINNLSGVLGSSTTDFFAMSGTSLIQISGGNFTQSIFLPGFTAPGAYLAQSGNFIFVAGPNDVDIIKVDMTVPTAPVVSTWFTNGVNLRGMSLGTRGLYIVDTAGVVRLFLAAQFPMATGTPTAGTNASNLLTNIGFGGFAVSGTTIYSTDTANDQIRSLTDSGADAADSFGAFAVVAGEFTNVNLNGFQLQTNFEFTNFTPLMVQPDGKLLVGDDGADQFRLVTLGATPPQSTFTVALGTGIEGTGTTNKAATGADNIAVDALGVDNNGIVYFSDNSTPTGGSVRRVNAGLVEHYFGQPTRFQPVVPGKNRLQTSSRGTRGLAFNSANELHVALTDGSGGDHVVVKIVNDVVTLVAGQVGVPGYSGDGFSGTQARLNVPLDIAINANNDLYILDKSGVRLLTNDNIMTSLFTTDESGFNAPSLAIDAAGKVYIANGPSNNGHIHRFSVTEDSCCDDDLILVAGDFHAAGWNGDGLPAIRTLFNTPLMDICFDPALGLLVADRDNHRLRAITNLAETTNTPPVAVIVASPAKQGSIPFKVRLDGGSSFDADGDIVKYAWDFGDGKTLTGRVVEHTYTNFGSFVVTLTVTDSKGQSSTAKTTVFAALPLVGTNTTGKGSFKIAFGAKGQNKDSFTIVATNVAGLTNQAGKSAQIFIGSFNTTGTVGGKGVKTTSKTVKLTIDTTKKVVALALKGVELDAAFAELGVTNENIVGGKTGKQVLIPVVINVDNGALVVGDSFLFTVTTKFNSGASGKYAQ